MVWFRWLPPRVVWLALLRLLGLAVVLMLSWLIGMALVTISGPDLNATVGGMR